MTKTFRRKSFSALLIAAMAFASVVPAFAASSAKYVGTATAKKSALAKAGVKASDATYTKAKLDDDDGVAEYEIDFVTKTRYYEVDVNAKTGKVSEYSSSIIETAKPNKSEISISKAKKIAQEYAGVENEKVIYTQVQLKREGTIRAYDIEFVYNSNKYEFEINAETGNVLEYSVDGSAATHNNSSNSNSSSESTKDITSSEAKKIAQKRAGLEGKKVTFTKVKTDVEDGIRIYEVEFRYGNKEYEFEINAKTGEVMTYDIDSH